MPAFTKVLPQTAASNEHESKWAILQRKSIFSQDLSRKQQKITCGKVTVQSCLLILNRCDAFKNQNNNADRYIYGESAFEFKIGKINEKNYCGCLVLRSFILYFITCIRYNRISVSGMFISVLSHMVISFTGKIYFLKHQLY